MDLSDAKVAEEEDDEGFMCASVAHCPKAKIASRAKQTKISGDAKDAGEVARPEADLSMSKVAEGGVSIAKDAEKIAAVAKAAEEVAKPEVVTVQPEPAQLLEVRPRLPQISRLARTGLRQLCRQGFHILWMYAQACSPVYSSYPHQPRLKYTLQHCSVCYAA